MSPSLDHAAAVRWGIDGARGLALTLPNVPGGVGDGAHFSSRPGHSQEFQEYRDYRAGDDLRHLDWSVYGRSDRLVVRQFRQEVSPHLDLVVDGSRSMDGGGAKASAATSLVAFFSACAGQGGFKHRVWEAGDRYRLLGSSPQGPRSWRPWSYDGASSPRELLAQRQGHWQPRGLRILISDLLWPGNPATVLRGLTAGAVAVVVVQVVSAEEVEPSHRGAFRLQDAESGDELNLHLDEATVASYRQALERHRQSWLEACRRCGALMVRLVGEEVLSAWRSSAAGETGPFLEVFRELWHHRLLATEHGSVAVRGR